jgi:hypothetical protein
LQRQRDNKAMLPRMNPMEERGQSNHLFVEGVPVWYARNGRVNPEWLSACKEEGNLTMYIANHFKETAVQASTYGGVRGQVAIIWLPSHSIAESSAFTCMLYFCFYELL